MIRILIVNQFLFIDISITASFLFLNTSPFVSLYFRLPQYLSLCISSFLSSSISLPMYLFVLL